MDVIYDMTYFVSISRRLTNYWPLYLQYLQNPSSLDNLSILDLKGETKAPSAFNFLFLVNDDD